MPGDVPLEPSLFASDEPAELPWWSRTFCGYHDRFVKPFVLAVSSEAGLLEVTVAQSVVASASHAAEARSSADGLATASTVWDAGVVLGAMLMRQPPCPAAARLASDNSGGRCLDLGSGTGIVGLAAAASGLFRHVQLTDLPSVTALLRSNVRTDRAKLYSEPAFNATPHHN